MTRRINSIRRKKVLELYDLILLSHRQHIDPAPSLEDLATWTELPASMVYYYIQKMIEAKWLEHLNPGQNRLTGSSSIYLPQRPDNFNWADFDNALPKGRMHKPAIRLQSFALATRF